MENNYSIPGLGDSYNTNTNTELYSSSQGMGDERCHGGCLTCTGRCKI